MSMNPYGDTPDLANSGHDDTSTADVAVSLMYQSLKRMEELLVEIKNIKGLIESGK